MELVEDITEPAVETITDMVVDEKNTHVLLGLALLGAGVVVVAYTGHLVFKRVDRWNADRRQRKAVNISVAKA